MTRRKPPAELRKRPAYNLANMEKRLSNIRADLEYIHASINSALVKLRPLHLIRSNETETETD